MDLTRAVNLVLPRGRLATGTRFPSARIVSVVDWDKNDVYEHLDRIRFPVVERVNFLSTHPGAYEVLFRFFDEGLPREHNRWFRDLRPERVAYLGRYMCRTIRAQADAHLGELQ